MHSNVLMRFRLSGETDCPVGRYSSKFRRCLCPEKHHDYVGRSAPISLHSPHTLLGCDQIQLLLFILRLDGQMSCMARPKRVPGNQLQNFFLLFSPSNLVSHLGTKIKLLGTVLNYITSTVSETALYHWLKCGQLNIFFGDTEIVVIFQNEIAVIFQIWCVRKRTLHLIVTYLALLDANHQAEFAQGLYYY